MRYMEGNKSVQPANTTSASLMEPWCNSHKHPQSSAAQTPFLKCLHSPNELARS